MDVKKKSLGENVDVKKLCRMCAKSLTGTYINLLSSNENRPYVVILEHHTGVSVSNSDKLSTLVCTSCLNNLDSCDKLRSAVLRAQYVQYGYLGVKSEKLTKQGDLKHGLKLQQENVRKEENLTTKPEASLLKKSQHELNPNMSQEHSISPRVSTKHISLPCRVCLNTFTAVTFINHVCDTSKLIPCKKCRLNFKTNKELAEHEANDHKKKKGGRKDMACIHCDVNFETPEALEKHLLMVGRQSQKIYNCDYCTNFYTDDESCEEHMLECIRIKKRKL